MKYNVCPHCKKQISWRQRWRFGKGIGSRRPASCPHCGTMLVWSKCPFRMMNIALILSLLGLFTKDFFNFSRWILWLAIILMYYIGLFTLKFDIVGLDKNTEF